MSNQRGRNLYASAAAFTPQAQLHWSRQPAGQTHTSHIHFAGTPTSSINHSSADDWLADYKKNLEPTRVLPVVEAYASTHPNPTTANRPFAYCGVKNPRNISIVDHWFDSKVGATGPILSLGWPAQRGEVLKPWGTKSGATGFNLGDYGFDTGLIGVHSAGDSAWFDGAMAGGVVVVAGEAPSDGMPSPARITHYNHPTFKYEWSY